MNTTDNIRFMPKDWTFEGSNDGVNWDILDIQSDQSWYEGTIPSQIQISFIVLLI